MHDVPYGYCHCGCGQKTNIARKTSAREGHVKGTPLKFLHGHRVRLERKVPESPRPCECGCGRLAGIYRGKAQRFVKGHSGGAGSGSRMLDAWTLDESTGCWNWQGVLSRTGYGVITHHGVHWMVHRFFYTRLRGPIPDGLHLDHLCRNRACVNPDHLEAVTPLENYRRGLKTKLTEAEVRGIKRLLGTMKQRDIARRFGVGEWVVSQIKTGSSWRDVV